MLLTGGFTAAGAVRLLGAEITGQLNCSGAQLTGADSDGDALIADGMKAGSVLLDRGIRRGRGGPAAGSGDHEPARLQRRPADRRRHATVMRWSPTG